MGFISDTFAKQKSLLPSKEESLNKWREIFGSTGVTKEENHPYKPHQGLDEYRSVAYNPASYKRLLQAMRSMAPGGWSDNRWEQAKHLTGIQYVCVPFNTLVRMADGSYKKIGEIKLLDKVVTAEGNVHSVTHCFVNSFEGNLAVLRLWGHSHLELTPNHEVLTKRGYVPAGELTTEDWVALPRYSPEKASILLTAAHTAGETRAVNGEERHATGKTVWTTTRTVPDVLKLTPDFGRILGLYLAEAHTTNKGEITWSFDSKKEKDTLVPELTGLLEKYGFSPCVAVPKGNPSVMQVTVCGKLWVRLFHSLCGHKAEHKRIHPDLLAGPPEFLKALLEGWLAGDGHRFKDNAKEGATVSHALALAMHDIGYSLGLSVGIWKQKARKVSIFGRKAKKYKDVWKLRFYDHPDKRFSINEDKCVWRKVREVGKKPFSGYVYNLEVMVDQSYIAEGVGVHNCIQRTGEYLSQSEFGVFVKDDSAPEGKRPVKKYEDAYQINTLLEKPNNEDTFGEMMSWWNQQMDLEGSALTWMVPNMLGVPMELYLIPTALAVPQAAINPDFPDGYYQIQPVYPYGPFSSYPTPATAAGARIPAEWMMRFKYPHPLLRYDGYSPLTALRLHIDEIEGIDRSRWYKMKRSINPSAVVNMDAAEGMAPLPEDEIARIHAEWEMNMGPENHGRLIVGTPGAEIVEFGSRPVDMEYQQGWSQLVEFVMAGWGITKPAAGMVDTTAYSTLFAALKQFHLLTLRPKVQRIGQKLTRFLGKFWGDDIIIEVKCPRIDDHEVTNSKIQLAIQAKAITKNTVCKLLELPSGPPEWDKEVAGTDPVQENPQQAMAPGQADQQMAQGQQQSTGSPLLDALQPMTEDTSEEPKESHQNRDRTGSLGEGAQGSRMPTKHLNGRYVNGKSTH